MFSLAQGTTEMPQGTPSHSGDAQTYRSNTGARSFPSADGLNTAATGHSPFLLYTPRVFYDVRQFSRFAFHEHTLHCGGRTARHSPHVKSAISFEEGSHEFPRVSRAIPWMK